MVSTVSTVVITKLRSIVHETVSGVMGNTHLDCIFQRILVEFH